MTQVPYAIEHVRYRLPVAGSGEPSRFRAQILEKTVYDASLLPAKELMRLGLEAAADAKRRGRLQRQWFGRASNGLVLVGYLDDQRRVTFLHPVLPRSNPAAPLERITEGAGGDELGVLRAFFAAIPDQSFIDAIDALLRATGYVSNSAGCSFAADLREAGDFDETLADGAVRCWVYKREGVFSQSQLLHILAEAVEAQSEQVPEQAEPLAQLLSR
jgi:hypothetical protein